MFKKGPDAGRGKGGKREGSGRPADWFRKKCERIMERGKLMEFVADVAKGEPVGRFVTEAGVIVEVPASVKDRLRAVEWLADRAFGKSTEHHDVTGHLTWEQMVAGTRE